MSSQFHGEWGVTRLTALHGDAGLQAVMKTVRVASKPGGDVAGAGVCEALVGSA